MVVDELFVKLGLQVDASSFAAVNKGLETATQAAQGLATATAGISTAAQQMATDAVAAAQKVAAAYGEIELPTAGGPLELEPTRQVAGPAATPAPAVQAAPPGFMTKLKESVSGVQGLVNAARAGAAAFAGMWAVQKVRAFTDELLALNTQIGDLANFTGLSSAAVQELGFVAAKSNTDIETLTGGLKKLTVNAAQAAAGSKADTKAFKALGIDVKDSSGNLKTADALFAEAADGISKLGTDGQQSAAAVALFGQAGIRLLPILKRGSSGIAEMRAEARALGGGLSDETIAQINEFEAAGKDLDFALVGLKSTIGNLLLPVLTTLTSALTKLVAGFKDIASNTYLFEAAIGVALFASLVKVIPLVRSLTMANLRAAASAALAALPYVLWAAAFAAFAIAIDEILNLLKGNETVVGKWLDEWLGIGTTDQFVRSWAEGIDSLATSFKRLGEFAEATWKVLKGIFTLDSKTIKEGAGKAAGMLREVWDDTKTAANAYVATVSGTGPDAVNIATGQGLNAGAISDPSIPRTVAQGLAAGRQLGSAGFGQASRSHLDKSVPNIIQTNSVTVNTGATAAEVKQVIHAEQGKTNRRLKAALTKPAPAKAP